MHHTDSHLLLFCWSVWSFIPKRSCTSLDALPGHNERFLRKSLENVGSRCIIVLGMASQNCKGCPDPRGKAKKATLSCGHVETEVSMCLTAVALLFLHLKSLTGEHGMHVSFYTVLWGFHNPVWPCSSAFIMSLRHGIRTLAFCSHSRTFPQLPLWCFPWHCNYFK